MKTLLTTTALLALVTAGPAFAQSDTAPMTTEPPAATDQMAPDAGMAPDTTMDAPAATDQMAPDATAPAVAPDQSLTETETMTTAPADSIAATDEVYIGTQASEEDLASNWMGKSLYNGADENLGDINDILIGSDGRIRAVIVGVGGFLGIGEKDVAVSFTAIEPRADADGNVDLYLNATQEQLEAAPDFETVAEATARSATTDQPAVVDPAMDPAAPAMDPAAPAMDPAAPAQ
jgi:hypothetical protein